MKNTSSFRAKGAIGALLDEYERALHGLYAVLRPVTTTQLCALVDPDTDDADCRSIQTILAHVVGSGYTYAIEVRKWMGEKIDYREKVVYSTIDQYLIALQEMFRFNEALFEDYPLMKLEAIDPAQKMTVRWGQQYDVEQLFEHAIVHILRHRRQIERFLQQLAGEERGE